MGLLTVGWTKQDIWRCDFGLWWIFFSIFWNVLTQIIHRFIEKIMGGWIINLKKKTKQNKKNISRNQINTNSLILDGFPLFDCSAAPPGCGSDRLWETPPYQERNRSACRGIRRWHPRQCLQLWWARRGRGGWGKATQVTSRGKRSERACGRARMDAVRMVWVQELLWNIYEWLDYILLVFNNIMISWFILFCFSSLCILSLFYLSTCSVNL